MVIRQYPEFVEKLYPKVEPYKEDLFNKNFEDIPEDVLQAYEKLKEWAWSLGQ